jgi:peptidylprolyl isomerase
MRKNTVIQKMNLLLCCSAAGISLLSSCSDSDKTATSSGSGTATANAAETTAGSGSQTASTAATPTSAKPTVEVPKTPAPTELVREDLTPGTGKEATAGSLVSVNYVGVAYSTGKEFDSSWSRNQPIELVLGAGQVIKGWDEGLVGMKEGGRRKLIIPASMAYGAAGNGPDIGPNESLIFVVDLVKVATVQR